MERSVRELEAGRAILVIALAFVLVATSPIAAGDRSGSTTVAPTVSTEPPPLPEGGTPDAILSPGDKDVVSVVVVTTNVAELADFIGRLTGVPVQTPRPAVFA